MMNEESFSGIVDRFQLFNELLLLEQQYQNNKLLYMEELLDIFEKSIHPSGISDIAKQIYHIKHQEVYYNLNALNFHQDYQRETEILRCKASILRCLKERTMRHEEEEAFRFKEQIKRHNHLNNTP